MKTSTIIATATANNNQKKGIIPVISSITEYSSLFPTQAWSANGGGWDTRTLPWEGNGVDLSHDMDTDAVFAMAGLNYGVVKVPCYVDLADMFKAKEERDTAREAGTMLIPSFIPHISTELVSIPMFAIMRDDRIDENAIMLGTGTERLNPLANEVTRNLCNILFNMGFRYENAGVFDNGKVTYVSMKWKGEVHSGEAMDYYVVIVNSFDGSKPFGVYITPVRVSCKNTLNLAIRKAVRFWKVKHTKNAEIKIAEVIESLDAFDHYIKGLDTEIDRMKMLTLSDDKVKSFIDTVFPVSTDMTQRMIDRAMLRRQELAYRYLEAPDLDGMEKSGWRLMCALSDMNDHRLPERRTETWKQARMLSTLGRASVKEGTATEDIVVMGQRFIDSLI